MKTLWKLLGTLLVAVTMCVVAFAALPENVAALSQAATAQKYPDAHTVLLFDDERVSYDEKGFATTHDAYFVKILTEAGRRENRIHKIPFNCHYEKIAMQKLVIYRDGKEIVLDPAKVVSEESDTTSLENNICDPNDRMLCVKLPDVRIGDVIYFDFVSREVAKRMPGAWQGIAILQMTHPCLEYHYLVDAPEKLPLAAVKLRNEVAGTVQFATEKRDGRILYSITAKEVPQVFFESAMFGAKWHALQRYHLSTVKSWEEVSRWYARLAQPHLEKTSDALVDKVKTLTAACKSDAEKVAALFQYVSQHVRYMGLIAESEAPGYEPHDVAHTFEQRAGVCRDKAALLVAMLRIAGLKSHMVLISAGNHLDPEVPVLHFNHAIAAWEKTPGVYELMDPTAENTQEMLPVFDADSSYLVATEKGETLHTTPAPLPEKDSIVIETSGEIDYEGSFHGHVVCRPTGIFETAYRSQMQNLLTQERFQFIQSLIHRIGGGVILSHIKVTPTELTDLSENLVIEFDFDIFNALPESDCAEAFPIPRFAEALGYRSSLIGSVDRSERLYPKRMLTALVEEKMTVKLPLPLQVITTPEINFFHSRIADWESQWSVGDHELTYSSRLALKTLCVESNEYEDLKTLSAKLKHDNGAFPVGQLVFRGIPIKKLLEVYPGFNEFIVLDETNVELLSESSMRETRRTQRKIMTIGGVRQNSEIILPYRPERERVEISATITSADGKKTVLTKENIHEVDDPVFSGAPRYAKGKQLVVNLPGVRPGSTIETVITKTSEKLPFLSGRYVFGGFSSLLNGRFSLVGNSALPLKISDPTRNGEITNVVADGVRKVGCTTNNHPGTIRQKNQPPLFFFCDGIQFSTGDLAQYAKRTVTSLQTQVTASGAVVDKIAGKLTLDDASSAEAKLVRIRDWVDQNIRLAGPTLDMLLPGEFTPPDRTISDGYGNSSDRAIVIAALCRKAGIETEFLLVSDFPGDLTTIRFISRVPGLDFKRVLVRRRNSDYILNDTGMYATLGATRSEGCLAMNEKGRCFALTPKVRRESGSHRKFSIELEKTGAAHVTVETIYYGNEYESARKMFAKLTPELKRRYFEALALSFSPTAKVSGKPEIRMNTYPGSISFSFEQADFAVRRDRFLSFDLPGFSDLLRRIEVGADRETPLWTDRQDLRLEYDIAVPHGFVPTTKADGRREYGTSGSINYLGRSIFAGNKISISHQLFVPKAILPASKAYLVELAHRKLSHPHERRIVLENLGEKKELSK